MHRLVTTGSLRFGMGRKSVFAECRALGLQAQSICEVASLAGWTTIGEAARGIIEMVEALINSGAWHTEALQLHVEASRS
jgi:hypothetical protein